MFSGIFIKNCICTFLRWVDFECMNKIFCNTIVGKREQLLLQKILFGGELPMVSEIIQFSKALLPAKFWRRLSDSIRETNNCFEKKVRISFERNGKITMTGEGNKNLIA